MNNKFWIKLFSNKNRSGVLVYSNFEKLLKYVELFVFLSLFALTNLSFFFVDVFKQDPEAFLIVFSIFLLLIPGFLAFSVLGKLWLKLLNLRRTRDNLLAFDLKVIKKLIKYLIVFMILMALPTTFIVFWLKDIDQGIIVLKITFSFYIFLSPFFFKSQISIYREERDFRRKKEKLAQANVALEKLKNELKNKSVDEVLKDENSYKTYSDFYKTLNKQFEDKKYAELDKEINDMKSTYSLFFPILEDELQDDQRNKNKKRSNKVKSKVLSKRTSMNSLAQKKAILEKIKKLS